MTVYRCWKCENLCPSDQDCACGNACMSAGVEPTFVTANEEVFRSALAVAEHCLDFGTELLALHDQNLGRELKRHKMMAEQLELSIAKARKSIDEIRAVLGWPALVAAENK